MNADIADLVKAGKYVSGIIHVGANDGEEVPYYRQYGVQDIALFEPLPQAWEKCVAAYGKDPAIKISAFGWSDQNSTATINITENDKASSVLKTVPCDDPTKHPVFKDWNMGQWPVVDQTEIELRRYDWIVAHDHGYDASRYNTIVMDVQGMELEALKGMGDEIARCDYLIIELSETPVYEGEASGKEVSDWLLVRGLVQATPIMPHDNVLFIREGK